MNIIVAELIEFQKGETRGHHWSTNSKMVAILSFIRYRASPIRWKISAQLRVCCWLHSKWALKCLKLKRQKTKMATSYFVVMQRCSVLWTQKDWWASWKALKSCNRSLTLSTIYWGNLLRRWGCYLPWRRWWRRRVISPSFTANASLVLHFLSSEK